MSHARKTVTIPAKSLTAAMPAKEPATGSAPSEDFDLKVIRQKKKSKSKTKAPSKQDTHTTPSGTNPVNIDPKKIGTKDFFPAADESAITSVPSVPAPVSQPRKSSTPAPIKTLIAPASPPASTSESQDKAASTPIQTSEQKKTAIPTPAPAKTAEPNSGLLEFIKKLGLEGVEHDASGVAYAYSAISVMLSLLFGGEKITISDTQYQSLGNIFKDKKNKTLDEDEIDAAIDCLREGKVVPAPAKVERSKAVSVPAIPIKAPEPSTPTKIQSAANAAQSEAKNESKSTPEKTGEADFDNDAFAAAKKKLLELAPYIEGPKFANTKPECFEILRNEFENRKNGSTPSAEITAAVQNVIGAKLKYHPNTPFDLMTAYAPRITTLPIAQLIEALAWMNADKLAQLEEKSPAIMVAIRERSVAISQALDISKDRPSSVLALMRKLPLGSVKVANLQSVLSYIKRSRGEQAETQKLFDNNSDHRTKFAEAKTQEIKADVDLILAVQTKVMSLLQKQGKQYGSHHAKLFANTFKRGNTPDKNAGEKDDDYIARLAESIAYATDDDSKLEPGAENAYIEALKQLTAALKEAPNPQQTAHLKEYFRRAYIIPANIIKTAVEAVSSKAKTMRMLEENARNQVVGALTTESIAPSVSHKEQKKDQKDAASEQKATPAAEQKEPGSTGQASKIFNILKEMIQIGKKANTSSKEMKQEIESFAKDCISKLAYTDAVDIGKKLFAYICADQEIGDLYLVKKPEASLADAVATAVRSVGKSLSNQPEQIAVPGTEILIGILEGELIQAEARARAEARERAKTSNYMRPITRFPQHLRTSTTLPGQPGSSTPAQELAARADKGATAIASPQPAPAADSQRQQRSASAAPRLTPTGSGK